MKPDLALPLSDHKGQEPALEGLAQAQLAALIPPKLVFDHQRAVLVRLLAFVRRDSMPGDMADVRRIPLELHRVVTLYIRQPRERA